MSLRSHVLDACKSLDAAVGIPAGRVLGGRRRSLQRAPTDALVIRLWGLGNLALLAPHLHAARHDVRLRLLTLERNGDFVRRHLPWVEPLLVPDPGSPRCLPSFLSRLRSLGPDRPDVIVDAEQFLRMPLLGVRWACPAPTVGLDTPRQGRAPLLDHPVAYDPTRHVADTFAALWRAAGLPVGRGPGPLRVDASLFPADDRSLGTDDHDGDPLVVIHPGSGDHFPGRRWPAERFGALARRLRTRHRARILVTGLPSEAELVRTVLRHADGHAVDLCGQLDSARLVALLARADLLVTNDTGPLHLADAVGTRAVALYGPNTPHRYGPRLAGSRSVFADLPCSPCLDDRSMKRSSCRDHVCMDVLSVDLVEQACASALPATPADAVRALEAPRALAR